MGGKNKQAQRTKNNARPSSSGRSAEMLAATIPHFAAFHAAKETNFTLPGFSLAGTEDIDSTVDSNFQLVLKKMNKKDSTTKLKALQEFSELIKISEPEAVKAVLSFWPRLYNTLATDAEHRVREAAHVAHHEVVLKAKRNLAPFLKQLVGAWFTSQYDTYAPAATAASKAFEAAFPPSKIQDAIVFCQEEILTYIFENLVSHSAQTLSNPKTTSTDDAEAKYERVIISSLQGYSLYLTKLNTDAIEKSSELNEKLISNSKFWKLSKHKVAPIRAAWFGVLTALCQKAAFLLEKEELHVSTSVFGNLDESEPTVLPLVWEAALLTITTIREWWNYINIEKMFLPKLWKVLREGGQGNAVIIFPNLLPLISHLPPDLDINNFYSQYFENIRTGLKNKNVLASRSEMNAVSSAIVECLQYIILKNQSDAALCEKLIKTQLFPLLEWCFIEPQSPHKIIFTQIAAMVQYWSRNVSNSEMPHYKRYLSFFWSNLLSLFQGLLMNLEHNYEDHAVKDFALKHIDLLLCLKHTVRVKKQQKVKFFCEDSEELSGKHTEKPSNGTLNEMYAKDLESLVYETCELYIHFINKKQSKELIEYLGSIIQDFESEHFFQFLNEKLGGGDTSTCLIDFYGRFLSKWMKSPVLSSKSVIQLLFLLTKYLNDDAKETILDELSSFSEDVLGWCIAQALSHPYNEDRIIQNWLSMEFVGKYLVKIVHLEMTDECTPELSLLLKQAFTENHDGVLFISEATVLSVISSFKKCLLSPEEYLLTIDTCASLAAYVSEMLYTETLILTYGDDLLLALFALSFNTKIDAEYLSKDTMWEVNTAWQDGISVLSSNMDNNALKTLASKFADVVEKQFLETTDVNLELFVDKIVNFVRSFQKCKSLLLHEILLLFFNRAFLLEIKQKLVNICKNAHYQRGLLSSPYKAIEMDATNIDDLDIIKYFTWTHLIINVVITPIEEIDEDDMEEDEDPVDTPNILHVLDNAEMLLLNAVFDICLSETLEHDYKNYTFYKFLTRETKVLKGKLKEIFKSMDDDLKSKVAGTLQQKLDSEQWTWATATYLMYSELMPDYSKDSYAQIRSNLSNKLAKLHLLQVFSHSLSYDDVDCNAGVVESIITLKSLLHCDEIEVQFAEVYCKIDKLRNEDIKLCFYDVDFMNWEKAQLVIEVINLFSRMMKHKEEYLLRRHWDCILVSLCSWCSKMVEVKSNHKNLQVAAFIASVSDLFCSVSEYIKILKVNAPNSNYIDEWNDLFAQSTETDIMKVWFYFTEEFQTKNAAVSLTQIPFLQAFGNCLQNVNCVYLFTQVADNMPRWSKVLKRCFLLLLNSNITLQLWGYNMLIVMIPGLIDVDSLAVNTNTPHEKGLILEKFKPLLEQTHEIVQTMLIEFKLVENSCRVEPFTDSYTYTFAYLLIWDVILTLCENSSTELCYQYSDWLRKEDLLNNLLNNIFKLMPAEVLHYTDGKTKPLQAYFLKKFELPFKGEIASEKLEQMVCWVYKSTVSQLPASVRQWWSTTETRTAQIVERVTSAFVSPQLCLEELADVARHENKFKNMVVKVHPSVREVIAIYTVDEAQMELVITLPNNYPLGGPNVQCNRQIGGTSHKQWLMQLKKCVLHQNGRIWDGLSLWNNNLDKKFDGVEECYICFAVLHPGTYQLPKLCCQTCRKKFHSACLYKWFSTSNKSTCPICRNLF